jgi:hypothetical protein
MSDVRASESPERLPWIANENDSGGEGPRRARGEFGPWVLAALSAAAMLLVLALAYWIAMHNWQVPLPQSEQPAPTQTTVLPQPKTTVPPKKHSVRKHVTHAQRSPVPTVRLPAQREVPLALPRTPVEAKAKPAPERKPVTKTTRVAVAKIQPSNELSPRTVASNRPRPAPARRQPALPLPPSVYAMRGPPPFLTQPFFASPQAEGRVVHIGAFRDIHQARLWWGEMVRAYPQVGELQPSVIESRYSSGVPFYLFQIGTSSRANSVMLCQMMQRISLSCAVTGLPWRATSW